MGSTGKGTITALPSASDSGGSERGGVECRVCGGTFKSVGLNGYGHVYEHDWRTCTEWRAVLVPGLLAALTPFADVDGEGDEDFPDETKVTVTFGRTTFYALTLGDFRRARAAITKATS